MRGKWKMRKEIAIRKNLDLPNEFMKYAFANPKVLEGIPPEAELIILPVNDPELYEYNKKIADKMMSKGEKVAFVKMKKRKFRSPN